MGTTFQILPMFLNIGSIWKYYKLIRQFSRKI